MKVFKFHPPYKPSGRTSFPETQKRSGVYLIKENDKLVYVGFSGTDLYKTIYRHFQAWTDREYKKAGRTIPAQYRVTYKSRLKRNRYTVRVVFLSPAKAANLERALIIKNKPRDNAIKYEQHTLNLVDERQVSEYLVSPVELECPF